MLTRLCFTRTKVKQNLIQIYDYTMPLKQIKLQPILLQTL
ncbi:hypothetical protein KU06062659_110040 [Flavobacterium psychrophilum]|nr:hypothetical protein FI146_60053 [Flavobacterium psychrophilum]SNB00634.1 hypothetical protein FPC831_1220011 [Flavobacterium psychrophilum]SNB03464.1 hypothetical protein JIP0899_140001 [Flavobacterium psychrophilum]SNB04233.1 hypothetical protein JIP1600_1070028 [Flavobacterium psychrophilum]SNB04589.1 hypothetical protein KU06062659_110040 [Flavobacterium psychrophilum]